MHCCEKMQHWAEIRCDKRPDPAECPDNIILRRAWGDAVGHGGTLLGDSGDSILNDR